ncbi:MAG: hypothetical protein MUP82_00925 [Candidatus Marinimicrobia bacterium]|nr:hypothetical protein [Candidatus Neomarinimicrobiota bacterium]
MFSNENLPKFCSKYYCETCDYRTSKKSSYNDHNLSAKHKKAMGFNENLPKFCSKYTCQNCHKKYKDNSGLWRHSKKCSASETNLESEVKISNNPNDKDELITYLIKENQDFKNLILEIVKKDTYNQSTTNITNTNSHNKAFNLNFFLNETCKDAMNITEFVESIKLQLSDLERVGELGYVEGISSIIVKNLKNLDVTQRPVHCTDKKRETMYIKDENKWEKDEEQKKMHKMVRKVADKNARMLPKFKEAHPDCNRSTSIYSDQYNKIIIEAMGGRGDNDFEKEEKIIKRVSKEVTVEKDGLL